MDRAHGRRYPGQFGESKAGAGLQGDTAEVFWAAFAWVVLKAKVYRRREDRYWYVGGPRWCRLYV